MKWTLLVLGLCCCVLVGCQLLAAAAEAAGVPMSPGAKEAARDVDAAISGWFSGWVRDLLLVGAGTGLSESARATHRTVKRRRAKRTSAHITPPPVV